MQEILLFILTFTLILIIYQLFVVRKGKKGNLEKLPTEINYMKVRYHIHIDKSNYKQILNLVSVVSSFDIAVIVTVAMVFNHYFLQLLSILILSPLIFGLSYHLVGKKYQKEGK